MSDNNKRVANLLAAGPAAVRRIEVPGVEGAVYYLPMSARMMVDFQLGNDEAKKIEAEGGNPRHMERMVESLAEVLVTPDGEPAYTVEQLMEARVGPQVLADIFKAISGQESVKEGGDPNASSAATGSDSLTESLQS